MSEPEMGHGFRAIADRYQRGWVGQYQLQKAGASKIEFVRDDDGFVRLFATQEAAERAAARGLCRAIDRIDVQPRRSKTFLVRQTGRHARLVANAEWAFRGRPS